MVNSVSGTPNSASGVKIVCHTIDVSKLSKEERNKWLEKMPNCTVDGCYPPGYYMNNYAYGNNTTSNNTVKRRIHILTDSTMKSLDEGIESPNASVRLDAARSIIQMFGEDPTRYKDEGLNVLVNKMLLNPYHNTSDKKVRSYALMLLTNQLAKGNDDTPKILEALKNDPNTLDRHRGEAELALMKIKEDTTVANVPISGSRIIC